MRTSDTAEIFFDDVRVPQSHLIGEENKGFIYQMEQFQEERLFCAANVLKSLDLCIQDTIEYTRNRKAFNATLLDNQYIQYRLAELQTEVECLRALTYRVTSYSTYSLHFSTITRFSIYSPIQHDTHCSPTNSLLMQSLDLLRS
jgi:citronellyl-CoA dehydrogenase